MNTTCTRRLFRATAASFVLSLLLFSCRADRAAELSVADLVQSGEYVRAFDLAEREAGEDPENVGAQDTLAEMRVILELERGRRMLFAGEDSEALLVFEGARQLDPGNPTVAIWIEKTRRQLAERWLDAAQGLTGNDQLEQAEEAFEKVLQYDPGNSTAGEGLARILLRKQYREGLGLTYYRDGLQALRDFEFWPADRDFGLTTEYDPTLERARVRQLQVRKAIVEQRIARALELERNEHYFASRNEYRLALLLDPDNEEASTGMDRMDLEVRTFRILGEVDMEVRRGEIEDARLLLEQSASTSEAQANAFGRLEARVEDARWELMYEEALSLYQDQLYEEAVASFDRLLAETEFYEDAVSRRRTLAGFISNAEGLYAKSLEASDPEEALGYLRQIEVFWAEYRDVRDRIIQLEAKLAEPDGE
jgi:tetratricopeptide (TPR) repeat protein